MVQRRRRCPASATLSYPIDLGPRLKGRPRQAIRTSMNLPRRTFLHLAAGAAALPVTLRFAWARAYPTRSVRSIVPFPAGQATDTIAQLMGQSAPAPAAEKLQLITEFFDDEIATGKLPGAVILIQQYGRLVYLKCFGVRDVTTKLPMTP